MAAPTLVAYTAAGTSGTTSITAGANAAQAGDLAVIVAECADAGVTATIGATSGISPDAGGTATGAGTGGADGASNGTQRAYVFSKVLVAGDLTGGNFTAAMSSAYSTGTKRFACYVFRHANGWDATLSNRRVGTGRVNVTASGTSRTLTEATAMTRPGVGVVAVMLNSTAQAQTMAWDGAAAVNDDYPGSGTSSQGAHHAGKPNNAGTVSGYDTDNSRTQQSVVVSAFGASQNAACLAVWFQTAAVTTVRSTYRSSGASTQRTTARTLVRQALVVNARAAWVLRGLLPANRVGAVLRRSSAATRQTTTAKTLISVPIRSTFRAAAATVKRFAPRTDHATLNVRRPSVTSIVAAAPRTITRPTFRSAAASARRQAPRLPVAHQPLKVRSTAAWPAGRVTPGVVEAVPVVVRSTAAAGRARLLPVTHTRPAVRSTAASSTRATAGVTHSHDRFVSSAAAVTRALGTARLHPTFRDAMAAVTRGGPIVYTFVVAATTAARIARQTNGAAGPEPDGALVTVGSTGATVG